MPSDSHSQLAKVFDRAAILADRLLVMAMAFDDGSGNAGFQQQPARLAQPRRVL